MTRVKISKQATSLKHEVELLRSFVIGFAGRDKEGSYRPEFVKKILGALNEKPRHTFSGSASFLRKLVK